MEYKVWALAVSKLTDSDIVWLQGLKVETKVEPLTNKVYTQGQLVSRVVTGLKIDVITTCEKQETMLKLKYGDDLVLKSVINSLTVPYEDFNMVPHFRSTAY